MSVAICFIDIDGTAIAVTVSAKDGEWLAYHEPTNAYGAGRTRADAMDALREMLREDRAFYCGIAVDLPFTGALAARRETVQRVFRCAKVEVA